jgi:hypothetical protein
MNITVDAPRDRAQLLSALSKLHRDSTGYWNAFSDDAFFRPLGQAWSPSDNVRHLTKSIRPVAQALRLPRIVLGLAFGRAAGPARTYEQMTATYHAALDAGAKAGRFGPTPSPFPADPAPRRAEIMAERDRVSAALDVAAARWRDAALDRYRMPHPVLGKLTVREMLTFTLLHNLHHMHVVERRRAEAATAAAQPA